MAATRTPGIAIGADRRFFIDKRHRGIRIGMRVGPVTQEQAENHPSRNIISRALGAEPTVDVELKTIMFEAGTTFMICSDFPAMIQPAGKRSSSP